MIAYFLLYLLEIFSLNVTRLEVEISTGFSYKLPLNGLLGRSVLLSKYNIPARNETSIFPIYYGEDIIGKRQYKLQYSHNEWKEEILYHLEEKFFDSNINFLSGEPFLFNMGLTEYEFQSPIMEAYLDNELKVLNTGIDFQINRLITDTIFPRLKIENYLNQLETVEDEISPLSKTCSLILNELQTNSEFYKKIRSGEYVMTFFNDDLDSLVKFFSDLNDHVLDCNFVSVINKLASSLFVSSDISHFLEGRGIIDSAEQKKYAKWLILMDFNNILNLYDDPNYKFKIINFNEDVESVTGIPHFKFQLREAIGLESLVITDEEGKAISCLNVASDSNNTYIYNRSDDLKCLNNSVIKISGANGGCFYESDDIEIKFQ